jgi:transcriptional regulator with PAS, ATPase and Fis domain
MPFVNITCTAMAETLLESELFGHERGAFTDARQQKKGLMEVADGGTVFLDEIGDMPANLQAKLLRFLEERSFRRVGGVKDVSVDVRIISATNRDVEAQIRDGKFREDLFYRLNIIPIYIPPLRERGDDALILAQHYAASFSREFRRKITDIHPEALRKLRHYSWPGNVRELRNAVERAVLLSKGEVLGPDDFVLGTTSTQGNNHGGIALPAGGIKLADVEEQLVREALSQSSNNQTRAAKLLGISRDQLRYRMERYSLR